MRHRASPKKNKNSRGGISQKKVTKPKRPLSAYMLFMQDFRKKNSKRGWSVTEMVSKGAAIWNKLTLEEKTPYTKAYRKAHAQYENKMESYKNAPSESAAEEESSEDEESYISTNSTFSSAEMKPAKTQKISKTKQNAQQKLAPTKRLTAKAKKC